MLCNRKPVLLYRCSYLLLYVDRREISEWAALSSQSVHWTSFFLHIHFAKTDFSSQTKSTNIMLHGRSVLWRVAEQRSAYIIFWLHCTYMVFMSIIRVPLDESIRLQVNALKAKVKPIITYERCCTQNIYTYALQCKDASTQTSEQSVKLQARKAMYHVRYFQVLQNSVVSLMENWKWHLRITTRWASVFQGSRDVRRFPLQSDARKV